MDILAFEQNGYKVYQNSTTKMASKGRYTVLKAVDDNLKSEFVLFVEKDAVYSSETIYDIANAIGMFENEAEIIL